MLSLLAGVSLAGYDALSVGGKWLIDAYKHTVSPVQAPDVCNYWPTCSQFTRGAVDEHGLLLGTLMGADRITRCNPAAWSDLGVYYLGGISHERIVDPPHNHVAWVKPDEAGGPVLAAAAPEADGREAVEWQEPNLAFAERLYADRDFPAAATEFLRVRFLSTDSNARRYSTLMAAESYLADGRTDEARHAFTDASDPAIAPFTCYGFARVLFAEARYDSTESALDQLTGTSLSAQAATLRGWTLYRRHRFAEGAATLAETGLPGLAEAAALDGRGLPHRSRLLGSLLSAVLPGAGQLYAGRPGDALYSLLAVSAPGVAALWFAADPSLRDRSRIKTAVAGAAGAVFYAAGIYGANIAARDYNGFQERRYVARVEELLTRVRLTPDYHEFRPAAPTGVE